MKKYQITVTEEQRRILQSLLCDAVMNMKDEAMSIAEKGNTNADKCIGLLKDAANADRIWTAVNRAERVEGDDEDPALEGPHGA